mgnify:CR=1 FL=1
MGEILLRTSLVAVGGAAGAVARYLISGWVSRAFPASFFPWGTLTVNVTGSLLLGLLLGATISGRLGLSTEGRLLLAVGGLGAFTTFSTFAFETLEAGRAGDLRTALMNVSISLIVGLLACWIGLSAGERL